MTKIKAIDFEAITLRSSITSRGGGIEIDLGKVYKKYKGHKMTAYQNYLGGGLLGKVLGDCTLKVTNDPKLAEIMKQLKQYFHGLTNPESEWETKSFEENQNMPISGF
jgi:hypothetical protein